MHIIADLQIHSKYSRAVSKAMTIPGIYDWAMKKGIDLVATGDWTHPLWMREIEEHLVETGNGFLKAKSKKQKAKNIDQENYFQSPISNLEPRFLLATEVSCIYTQAGKGRRVHTLIWVPSLESAKKINKEMTHQGCNLMSDGRPIIGLTSIQVAELVFTIEPNALIIPAHCWTPWFAMYGSMSGFNSIDEAFGPYAEKIYAVETGLSSNPAMNWQIKELDHRSIVSFSDAHSGPKLGREATVLEFDGDTLSDFGYQHLYDAIAQPQRVYASRLKQQEKVKEKSETLHSRIAYTIEFYPEEGKYHFTGHRACNIRWGPDETRKNGIMCPVCGKPLTQGVVQRVEELSGRTEKELKLESRIQTEKPGVSLQFIHSKAFPDRPPFVMLVPLQEIIAECIGSPVASKKTERIYTELLAHFSHDFAILLATPLDAIAKIAGERIAQGIGKVRVGDIIIDPGYDGVFGVVKLWKEGEEKPLVDASKQQLSWL